MVWAATGAVVVLVVLGLVLSYRRGRDEPWDLDAAPLRLQRAERERERILRQIKDLDFEYEAGSVSEGDYRRIRNAYKLQAVRRTQERDRLARDQIERLGQRDDLPILDRIEADVSRLKESQGAG